LAVFPPAPEIGYRIDSPLFHPDGVHNAEGWGEADVEAPISVEHGGIFAIALQAFFISDDHGDPGAVLGGVEDLFGFVILRVEVDLWLPILLVFTGLYIVPIYGTRGIVIGEGEVKLTVLFLSPESAGTSQAGQFDFPYQFSVISILVD